MKPETTRRAAALAGDADGAYVVADAEERIVAVSDAWLRAHGRAREELLGRRLSEVTPGRRARVRLLGATGAPALLLVDGGERERLFGALMRLPAGFALRRGPEHRFELVNERFLGEIGSDDLIGKSSREVMAHLDEVSSEVTTLDRVYQSGEPMELTERALPRRHPDGTAETRWYTTYYQPLRQADGPVEGIVSLSFDVTAEVLARRHADANREAYKESEERFRLAVAAGQLGTWHCRLPFDEMHWDDTVREHFGVHRDVRVTVEDFYRFLHPEDRERTRAAIDRAIAERGRYDDEYRAVAPDDGPTPGRVRWIHAFGRAYYDAEGRPTRFDGVSVDVTDQRGADDALVQARRLRDIIVGAIGDGVIAVDARGTIVFANQAGARLSGFASAEELVAASRDGVIARWEVFDEAGLLLPRAELPVTQALGGRPAERVLRLRDRRSGEQRWILFTATPVIGDGGRVELVVGLLRDLTERRRADETQRFLAEASSILGSSLDYEATLRTVAQLAVPRLADWCAVEMRTTDGSEQLAVAHVDPQKVELAWELRRRYPPDPASPSGVPQVLRSGQPVLWAEISEEMLAAGTRDAEQLRISRALGLRSALIVPINVSTRGTVGAITLVSAESGRRYTDADLSVAMELASRAALAVENSLLYSEAQRAVRLRDDFLSIAGHELRTPLTALQLQLQGLSRTLKRPAPPTATQIGERLDKATLHLGRLERLINELLDVSRIATGRLLMHPETVDLEQLAREVIERFGDDFARQGSPVSLRVPSPVVGQWDRLRLDQVITNLVSNALKYGAGQPITVEIAERDGRARLTVRDRGIGISPDDQKRIFGRFERAVSERHYGGLGLGLWIVRQIVEAHGGSIALHSEPGVETAFTVELPR